MIFRWLYISTSRLPEDDAGELVRDIVSVSIPRNASLDVTGALLFTGHNFAQYLEGSADAVAQLRASIVDDLRHEDVRTIAQGPFPHRRFVTWSLAYVEPWQFALTDTAQLLVNAAEDGAGSAEALADYLSDLVVSGRG